MATKTGFTLFMVNMIWHIIKTGLVPELRWNFCFRDPCSSLAIWKGVIVGAYCSGQIRVYNLQSGKLGACVNAHARSINAIDVAKDSGMVSNFSSLFKKAGSETFSFFNVSVFLVYFLR